MQGTGVNAASGTWVRETSATDQTRFRSFAERYLLTRAPHWPVGKETELAWEATLDAKRLYRMIEQQGKNLNSFIKEEEAVQF
jgi:hypothetical protein